MTQGYVEFDRRLIAYQLKKNFIVNEQDLLLKLVDDSLPDVPFFCREYKITYDRDFNEFTRNIEVNYPNKLQDSISLFDANAGQLRFDQRIEN